MKYRYAEMMWYEIKEAAERERVAVVPVAIYEDHGPHLPVDVDFLLCTEIAERAVARIPAEAVLAPPVAHGFSPHHMDFHGTITIEWDVFIRYLRDVGCSVAYHGFKKVIIVNGHGSNRHLLELVARRTALETDAVCAIANWWDLLLAEPDFNSRWRESVYPGGCGHACELETSMLLHLDPEAVRRDRISDNVGKGTAFHWTDLFAQGPVSIPGYHSQGTETGASGQPSLATEKKGETAFEGAVRLLLAFADEFDSSPIRPRKDHHNTPPTFPVPG